MTTTNEQTGTQAARPHHEDVAQFMAASGQEPSLRNTTLYMNLVREEFGELKDAFAGLGDPDVDQQKCIEDTLDALADLVWVAYGMALAMGASPERVWRPVAVANLAKIDPATSTVLKRADGKVIKPEGWVAPSHTEEASRVLEAARVRGEPLDVGA